MVHRYKHVGRKRFLFYMSQRRQFAIHVPKYTTFEDRDRKNKQRMEEGLEKIQKALTSLNSYPAFRSS